MTEPESAGPSWRASFAVGATLLALAAVVAFDITRMAPPGAVGVAPTAAMRIVAGLLVILGLAHLVVALRARALRKTQGEEIVMQPAVNHAALGWVLGGLVGMIAILQFDGGFIVGSAWLFALTARAFGQPLMSRSPAIGVVLAIVVYAFFTKALSLTLPAGPLEYLLFG